MESGLDPFLAIAQAETAGRCVLWHESLCYTASYAPTMLRGGLVPSLGEQIDEALRVLKWGGLVVFPTDTVYGLGADPRNPDAVARVYDVKRRSRDMALPLLASGVRQVATVAVMACAARLLARRYWPGALTLVLPRKPEFPGFVAGGGPTLAVRVPRHRVPVALARGLGVPIVGTSANISGRASPVTAAEAAEQLGGLVEFIIDGGACPGGIESTVIDVSGGKPRALRHGALRADAVLSWLESAPEGC